MPFTVKDTRPVDPIATQYIQAFLGSEGAFVADLVSVPIQTNGQGTGTYFTLGKETFFGSGSIVPAGDAGMRAVGAPFVRLSKSTAGTGGFKVNEYGFEDSVDDTAASMSGLPIQLEEIAQQRATLETRRARELRVQSVFQATASITQNTTLSGVTQWDDYDDSDPVNVIEIGIKTIKDAIAFDSSTMMIGVVTNALVMRYLKWHPDLANKLGVQLTKKIGTAELMDLFEIEELIVAEGYRNTAKLGQTVTLAAIWGDDFTIYARPRVPTTMTVVGHATFELRPIDMESYREDPRNTVWLASHQVDEVLTNASSMYLVKDCISASA